MNNQLSDNIRRLGERWQESLTKWYLDLAEALPVSHGGFVQTLQSIREHQRQRGDRFYAQTRASCGADVTYAGFRLLELFPAEEYERLITGLRKLFPAQRYGRDEIDRFGSRVPDLFAGGWSNIGILRRDKSSLPVLPTRFVPELPEGVDIHARIIKGTLGSTKRGQIGTDQLGV
jgi:hypothetical protein